MRNLEEKKDVGSEQEKILPYSHHFNMLCETGAFGFRIVVSTISIIVV